FFILRAPDFNTEISAWAVGSKADSLLLKDLAIIPLLITSTAPTGTSPFLNAFSASLIARVMKSASEAMRSIGQHLFPTCMRVQKFLLMDSATGNLFLSCQYRHRGTDSGLFY